MVLLCASKKTLQFYSVF